MQPAENLKIGRFPILKPLGRGSQGAVYLARDPDLDRLVAIKLMSELSGTPASDVNGWPAARNLAQLRHPNIIALFEIGQFHNFTYLVFEYLEGVALRKELKELGPMALPAAYSAIAQVTDAMAYAHAKGILHLDLNPNNIMRDQEGKPRIMDFDLSRRVDAQSSSEFITGTLPYMAPEHFKTHVLDARTDVYALGQIFYEMLTGQLAVPLAPEKEMIAHIFDNEAESAPLQRADPEGHFREVIRKATEKNPAGRYPHARAMHDALLHALANSRAAAGEKNALFHGTVAFVLKRIERRGDFPAVSKTLADINQLTREESQSPISRLSAVVLRDYALTNRLLKLANSSYYARTSGRVKTVSDAINLLGVEQVRLTCNGLSCFGHFTRRKQDVRLREESIASFMAGLISRHLAAQIKAKETEEAFLTGMLFHLGKMLALFYFSDDFEEMEDLTARGATPEEAARSVLGITLQEMGYAVGEAWGLPPVVLNCMIDSAAPSGSSQALGPIVRFANALTSADSRTDPMGNHVAMLAEALRPHLSLDPIATHALLASALAKFKLFAPALEVDVSKSACIQRLENWLSAMGTHLKPVAHENSSETT